MGVVIPFEGAGSEPRASIDPLVKLAQPDMDRVNESILARAHSHVELIPELAGHLINSGGKRIRPMLTLAAARMCGYGGDHHLKRDNFVVAVVGSKAQPQLEEDFRLFQHRLKRGQSFKAFNELLPLSLKNGLSVVTCHHARVETQDRRTVVELS